jgi:hypothetical protein
VHTSCLGVLKFRARFDELLEVVACDLVSIGWEGKKTKERDQILRFLQQRQNKTKRSPGVIHLQQFFHSS